MIRSTFKATLTSLVLVGVLTMPLARAARAQSPGDPVWVVDDLTTQAQALTTCTTSTGAPCPAGSLQVFVQRTISRADAEQQQRPYLEGTATAEQLHRFRENLYPHKATPINPRAAGVSPNAAGNCLETNVSDRWQSTIPNIGGNVSYVMTYHWHTDCTISAVSDSPAYQSGPGVWAYSGTGAFGPGDFFASDLDNEPTNCHGLPPTTFGFSGVIKFSSSGLGNGTGAHSQIAYYGTGQCNSYDPQYIYYYYWS